MSTTQLLHYAERFRRPLSVLLTIATAIALLMAFGFVYHVRSVNRLERQNRALIKELVEEKGADYPVK